MCRVGGQAMAVSVGCVQHLGCPTAAGTFQPILQVIASEAGMRGPVLSLWDSQQPAVAHIPSEALVQHVEIFDLIRLVRWEVHQQPGAWMLHILSYNKVGRHDGVIGNPNFSTMPQPAQPVQPQPEVVQAPGVVGGNSLRRELHDFAFSQGPEVIAEAPTPMRTRPVEVAPAHMVEKNPDVSRFGEETYHVSVSQPAPGTGVTGPPTGPPLEARLAPGSPRPQVTQVAQSTMAFQSGLGMSRNRNQNSNQPPAYMTVDGIAEYKFDNWKLLARVTQKSEKSSWKKENSAGTLFSADLVDERGVETRAVFFNKEVDKFFDILQKGKLYSFFGGRKKPGRTKWCSFKIELTFDSRASIEELPVSDQRCPLPHFDVKQLRDIEEKKEKDEISVAGIVLDAEAPSLISLRDGSQKKRQNLLLLDDSNVSCRVTFWGEHCVESAQSGSVVLLKNGRVSEYNNSKSLNTMRSSDISMDAAAMFHPRCQQLLQWYRQQGAHEAQNARSLSSLGGQTPVHTIEEMKASAISLDVPGALEASVNQQGFHLVPVTITNIPHDRKPFYMACPHEVADEKRGTRSCNKKMEPHGDLWQCAAGHESSHPMARWMCQFIACDHTGSQYIASFDEVGVKLLGCTANEAASRWDRREVDNSLDGEIEEIFKQGLFKRWRLKLKSKKEIYNDEEKLKISALDIWPLDFVKDARQKLAEIMSSLTAD